VGLVVAGLALSSGEAFAWGAAGHAVVADIAEQHLTPAARTRILNLLALEQHSRLDEVASWADEWRNTHRETGPWHYVDIPLTAQTYDAARDCKNDDCVVARTDQFVRVLADAHHPPAERLEALKYVVHFIGDLHQPLHAGENADEGGNKILASYLGETVAYGKYKMNLHSIWDTAVIERRLGQKEGPDMKPEAMRAAAATMAQGLDQAIRPADAKHWHAPALTAKWSSAAWAVDAHDLARDVTYRGIVVPGQPSPTEMVTLGRDYDATAWVVIQLQLQRAGIRLADILNAALK
jgi:hypothetical protein